MRLKNPPKLKVNPESNSGKKFHQSSQTSPRRKVELIRMSTEADMQSCQSTCMDSISVKELELLPSLNSELGDVIPKQIKSEISRIADTDKRNNEKHD